MFRLSCSSQTLTKHRFLAYPRESIPILRQISQAGECRKVKYSVLFLVGFYDPVFLDIGHIGVKVEGVVPEISFFNREGRKLYFSRYNGGKGRVNFYPYFTHFRAWPLPSCKLFIAQSLRCHLKFELANESARWTLLAQNRCELALESVTGRYDCSTVNRSQAWRSKGIFKNHYILKVSSKIRTIHWVSISMGILRKSKKIKQVIVSMRKSIILLSSSTMTMPTILESHRSETWRHIGTRTEPPNYLKTPPPCWYKGPEDPRTGTQRKRRWKSEFAFFQSSSRLLQVTNFVKCRRTLVKLNS